VESVIPGISDAIQLYPVDSCAHPESSQIVAVKHFDWVNKVLYRPVDPLSTSSQGLDYTGLGCFPIGMQASKPEFDGLVQLQSRLLSLNLLQRVESKVLEDIARDLNVLLQSLDGDTVSTQDWWPSQNEISLIRDLAISLSGSKQSSETLEVYLGLQTGFRASDGDSQFWSLYDGDQHLTRLFISRDVKDLEATVLHSYLSSRHCSRIVCFEAELALAFSRGHISEQFPLPKRMLQDLELLGPTESLILLQNIAISGSSKEIVSRIRKRCEYQLIDVASAAQLKSRNTISYLRDEISIEDLLSTRFQWYQQSQVSKLPKLESAIKLFKTIERVIFQMLKHQNRSQSDALISLLSKIICPSSIDVRADLIALSIFCTFRKLAYDEIYLDATDRCPLLGDQPDQAAVFAELWALGSRCEAYLDITPKALGKVLYDRYRKYYNAHPPPVEADDPLDIMTAYPSAKTDIDRDGVTDFSRRLTSKLQNTSYLGVFALPALIDILLLTTTGRGIYLSAFMNDIEQRMSTYALVMALVLCGAVSSWIGAGGTYYLWAMVYPTMNFFMVTRAIGGMVFTSVLAFLALILLTFQEGVYGAAIFLLYLMVLCTYLFLLGIMATLQFTGSPLPSVCQISIMLITGSIGTSSMSINSSHLSYPHSICPWP
jgi:hypothetical protein